jgi:hypothetical protein
MKKNLKENEKRKKNDKENWKKKDVYAGLKRKKKVILRIRLDLSNRRALKPTYRLQYRSKNLDFLFRG